MSGEITLDPRVLADVVGDGSIEAVKISSIAQEVLKVWANHVTSRSAAKVRKYLRASRRGETGTLQVTLDPGQRVSTENFKFVVVV
jgi:hypothetical protein